MPYISVIVPCYNQAQYLPEALQSVLDQSYTDWECIIVNDGSPDNTEEVAIGWCNKDPRFRYLKKQNGGISSARNAGIKEAKSKWILPLDADDKIGTKYLELAHDVMLSQSDIGLIYVKAEFFGNIDGYWDLPPYSYDVMLKNNLIYCSALYKKEDWIKAGGYDEKMKHGWEDWEFWINLLGKTRKGVFRIDYTGFYYRIRCQSRNYNFDESKILKIKTIKYVYKKHKDIYQENFVTLQSVLESNDCSDKLFDKFLYRLSKNQRNIFFKLRNRCCFLFTKLKHKA